jgi:hypothetical protein
MFQQKFPVFYTLYASCIQIFFSVYYDLKRSRPARECIMCIVSGGVVYSVYQSYPTYRIWYSATKYLIQVFKPNEQMSTVL